MTQKLIKLISQELQIFELMNQQIRCQIFWHFLHLFSVIANK